MVVRRKLVYKIYMHIVKYDDTGAPLKIDHAFATFIRESTFIKHLYKYNLDQSKYDPIILKTL